MGASSNLAACIGWCVYLRRTTESIVDHSSQRFQLADCLHNYGEMYENNSDSEINTKTKSDPETRLVCIAKSYMSHPCYILSYVSYR